MRLHSGFGDVWDARDGNRAEGEREPEAVAARKGYRGTFSFRAVICSDIRPSDIPMKWFLSLLLVVTLARETISSRSAPAERAGKFNVLFIAVDDLRPEFGAYGQTYVISPNLDGLAARGLVFNRAYCQQAVCSPSRSSLMTGTRPDTTKVWDLNTHFRTALPDVVTLPEHFKNNGYFVQAMGKLYHGGFDDPQSWSIPWTRPRAATYGLEDNLKMVREKARVARLAGKTATEVNRAARGPAFEVADVPDNTFHDGALADMAIKALGELKAKNRPFWLGVGFIRPHLPFVAPKKYWDLYDPAKIQLASNPYRPKDSPAYAIGDGGELRVYDAIPAGHIPDELARELKHGYYAAVSYMDAQIGRVVDELDRLGLRENTIIIVWGDHGWKLGEHDAWCKHSNVELDTNAPLIVSVPRMKSAGRRTEALVEFVDIYPTLAELCGLAMPAHLEGLSFLPLLDNSDRPWKTAAFSQYPRSANRQRLMGYTLRTDRYRYTEWQDRGTGKVRDRELYDHRVDPAENVNVAELPENGSFVADFGRMMETGWRGAKPPSN